MSGALAISSCGTIAAPCTGAMRSTRIRVGSCIAPRSRATRGPCDAQVRSLKDGPAYHLPDVPDPLCGSGQHLDGGPADQADLNLTNTQLGLAFSAFAYP